MGENAVRFGAGEDDREFRWPTDALDAGDEFQFAIEDLLEKKKESAEGLILSGRGDVVIHGQMSKECRDLFLAHTIGVTLIMKDDESPDPIYVGSLGAKAVMLDAQMPADAVQ